MKKKSSLRTLIAGLTVTSVALLGACSNGGETGTPDPTDAPTTGTTTDGATDEPTDDKTDGGGEGGTGDWGDFSGETITVAAAWSGDEQKNFEKVAAAFADATGATVNYESFGDNGPTFLQGRIEGNNPPNVAIISQPALMERHAKAGDLVELNDEVLSVVKENYSESWIDLGTVDEKVYGVWFKAANKSTMWYNADIWSEAGADPEKAKDWDGFIEQLGLIRDAGYAGVSVGADVGWPLTDWFENIYLRTAGPEKYDQLAKHEIPWTDPSVKEALEAMAKLWSSDVLQDGGAQRSFPDSVTEVFGADPKAGTMYEGDFVAGNITADGNSTVGKNAMFFDFPAVGGSAPAVMGGGDVAVAFVDDEVTSAFMRYLASPESASVWVPEGGLTSPNNKVDTSLYPDEVSKQIAESLTGAEVFRFDMSDLTPSEFGGTPGQGFWQEMISFYENPSDIDGTMERLEAAAASAYGG